MVFRTGTPSPQAQSEAEMEAIAILLKRSATLRRVLLVAVMVLAFGGGVGAAQLYVSAAYTIYGRVVGASFAFGAIVTFTILHRVSRTLARLREAGWIAELSRAHQVDREALVEAAALRD